MRLNSWLRRGDGEYGEDYLKIAPNFHIVQRPKDLNASPIPTESLDRQYDNRHGEKSAKLSKRPTPAEVTIHQGEEFFDPDMIWHSPPITLSRIDFRRWMLAAPLIKRQATGDLAKGTSSSCTLILQSSFHIRLVSVA
jgi:hypothetical protein